MAVMPEANLGSIIGRIGRNQLFIEHGLDQKFPGALNGAGGLGGTGAISPVTRRIAPPVLPTSFGPVTIPTVGTRGGGFDPILFKPLPGAIVGEGVQGAGAGGGSLGEAACNLLSGTAKQACLFALGFFGGDGAATFVPETCPAGTFRVGDRCVDPTALPPGGRPATVGAGGVPTVGAFGLPALSPVGEQRLVRKCGRGMVLGIDNLCYPKAVLTGRSKFRKWRRPVRPPISRRDVVAIGRAARAKDRVLELAKDVGLSVSKSRRAPKRHSQKHN